MKYNILKICLVFICLIFFNGCSFNYYFYDDYDPNTQFLEEEKRIEAERQKKIKSRNYIDETMNPYFSLLNNEEKQIYYDILENANSYNKEEFDLTYQIPIDNVHKVFLSVLYDNPELFWLKSYLYYTFEGEEEVISIVLKYYEDIEELDIMKQKLNDVVDKVVNEANNISTAIEKEKYVHDYLAKKIQYDMDMKEDQRSYGALVYDKAVCSGYAKAFQLIMRKLNIPTFYVNGDITKDGDLGPHAWNIIKLDEDYYNVDLTWNDRDKDNTIVYKYFNISDEEINSNHVRKELSEKLPNALGGKYSNLYN